MRCLLHQPFEYHGHINMTAGQAGDFDVFIDPATETPYVAYTHYGVLRVEQLSPDLRSSTGRFVGGASLGPHNSQSEAPAMFERQGTYYLLWTRFCCFCAEGSGAFVHTARHPLGPWRPQGDIGCRAGTEPHRSPLTVGCWGMEHERSITNSQLSYVVQTRSGGYVFAGDRWQQAPDRLKSHDPQVWLPLRFNGSGSVLPLRMVDKFQLP